MSDNEDNKKKGFFSRLFGGSSSPEETNNEVITPKDSLEIPTKSALNKMKKIHNLQSMLEITSELNEDI